MCCLQVDVLVGGAGRVQAFSSMQAPQSDPLLHNGPHLSPLLRCLQAWSTQHWVCLRTMHGRHEDTTWPACLALSPDGSLLASGSTGPFGASTIMVGWVGRGG